MRILALLLGVLSFRVSGAVAQDYFPLGQGSRWQYQETFPDFIDSFTVFIQGSAMINGAPTVIRRLEGGAYDTSEFKQYWSKDSEGDVFIHGWDAAPTMMRFDPPIRSLDLPLILGKTWSSSTNSSMLGPITFDFEVVVIGPVAVPAGVFPSVTVRCTSSVEAASLGISSLVQGSTSSESSQIVSFASYASGVGLVRKVFDVPVPPRFDQLLSYEPIVLVQPASWSWIRQRYR